MINGCTLFGRWRIHLHSCLLVLLTCTLALARCCFLFTFLFSKVSFSVLLFPFKFPWLASRLRLHCIDVRLSQVD
ncbi:hypothetical protein BJ508DRAFT_79768 [Ascobolus immersus RN42]|uniref:Uncharacterized protein n=1 Tax=Ascobolus immersus RN42 TaxID=1160509 RepID=A0A3N4HCK8_ASCIM|nr:hypothetical protein BJ508DRAFT_79768 [Ascobolus immersus RN42]